MTNENKQALSENFLQALRYLRTRPEGSDLFMLCNYIGVKLDQVASLIEKLKAEGYIEDIRVDKEELYSAFNIYCVAPVKMVEIDVLLRDDEENSAICIDNIDCQNVGLDHTTPACVNCKMAYKEGKIFCRSCLHKLVPIDTRMLDIIFQLNEKGYTTEFCCSGHADSASGAYLIISKVMDNSVSPDGFTIQVHNGRTELNAAPYNKRTVINRKRQRTVIDVNDIEKYIRQDMDNLRDWVRRLPSLKS